MVFQKNLDGIQQHFVMPKYHFHSLTINMLCKHERLERPLKFLARIQCVHKASDRLQTEFFPLFKLLLNVDEQSDHRELGEKMALLIFNYSITCIKADQREQHLLFGYLFISVTLL